MTARKKTTSRKPTRSKAAAAKKKAPARKKAGATKKKAPARKKAGSAGKKKTSAAGKKKASPARKKTASASAKKKTPRKPAAKKAPAKNAPAKKATTGRAAASATKPAAAARKKAAATKAGSASGAGRTRKKKRRAAKPKKALELRVGAGRPETAASRLGAKWVCFSCAAKFYDLNKEVAICPKCGADQADKPRNMPGAPPAETPPRPAVRPMAPLLDDEEERPADEEMNPELSGVSKPQTGEEFFDSTENAADDSGIE